jgi:hypothetical protein
MPLKDLFMKRKLIKTSFGLLFLFIVSFNSCKKEICKDCYRVDSNGIVLSSKTRMCGDQGISHLQSRGYLCKDVK